MKKLNILYAGLLICMILLSTATAKDYANIIENVLITAESNVQVDRDLMVVERLLADSSKFEKEGNFFRFKFNQKVFGHTAKYLSLEGIGFLPGPNVTLEGSPEDIANYIKQNYKLKFKSSETKTAFLVKIDKFQKFVIRKHPKLENSTIVIRAYLGP